MGERWAAFTRIHSNKWVLCFSPPPPTEIGFILISFCHFPFCPYVSFVMSANSDRSGFFPNFVRLQRVRPTAGEFARRNDIPTDALPANFDCAVEQNDAAKGLPSAMRIGSTDCKCNAMEYPSWTGEIHGLSQECWGIGWALYSKSRFLRAFWWFILIVCAICGAATTRLVVLEYLEGQTATSNTIHLVPNLNLPAITVCPKVPDAFNFNEMLHDMQLIMPGLTKPIAEDLIKYWIGGSGLENMNELSTFNESYLEELDNLYKTWRQGREPKKFFQDTQAKYGYAQQDFFKKCEFGGQKRECDEIFQSKAVMRRGLCFQTLENLTQTDADDIGRLVLEIKPLPSITSPIHEQEQTQTIIYINDKFDQVLDFPRFYLYPHEWNRMHITARRIELLEHPNDCTNKLFGKDSNCFVRNWLYSTVIHPFNCTFPYLDTVKGIPAGLRTCEPLQIARNYSDIIQRVHSGSMHSHKCIPGCNRWEYSVSLQQSPALEPFVNYSFNLEISFYDLQYEHVKEVVTITVPGFVSQIGGQFGFFLGLSIITVIQFIFYLALYIFRFFVQKTNFLGDRRRFDSLFAMFEIATKERKESAEREAGEGQRRDGGENTGSKTGTKPTKGGGVSQKRTTRGEWAGRESFPVFTRGRVGGRRVAKRMVKKRKGRK